MLDPELLETPDAFKTWANDIIKGQEATSFVEEIIQDYWYGPEWYKQDKCPVLFEITCDPYDWSLELHVGGITDDEAILDFCKNKVTKDFYEYVKNAGVCQFWINFYTKEERKDKKYEIYVTPTTKSIKYMNCRPDSASSIFISFDFANNEYRS